MLEKQMISNELRKAADKLGLWFYRVLPRRVFSDTVGLGARVPLPRPLRHTAYAVFSELVGVERREVARALSSYGNLNDFFTRALRPTTRPAPADASVAVSPCDGVLLQCDRARRDTLVQAKGKVYSISDLVGSTETARTFWDGDYVCLYLKPRDYHRVHAPVSGTITEVRYIPGDRFPMIPLAVRNVEALYGRNERVVIVIDNPVYGLVAVVMVAALGVGNMTLSWTGAGLTTGSACNGKRCRLEALEQTSISRGEELGMFNLGSTVVVLFEPHKISFEPLEPGDRICLNTPLGTVANEGDR
jgi:phosphatidylserine decarboxylase